MKIVNYLYFSLARVFVAVYLSKCVQCGKYFSKPTTQGRISDANLLKEVQVDSVLDCVMECSVRKECTIAVHHANRKWCKLGVGSATSLVTSGNATQWDAYVLRDDAPNTATPICESEWTGYGASCYYISLDFKTWDASDAYCKKYGGHLVTITSHPEQNFITHATREKYTRRDHALLNVYVWLGATDVTTEGDWMWSIGHAMNFSRWDTNEPSGGITENCLVSQQMSLPHPKWYDYGCSSSLPFICEKQSQ